MELILERGTPTDGVDNWKAETDSVELEMNPAGKRKIEATSTEPGSQREKNEERLLDVSTVVEEIESENSMGTNGNNLG